MPSVEIQIQPGDIDAGLSEQTELEQIRKALPARLRAQLALHFSG
jgi:hypothetical protein